MGASNAGSIFSFTLFFGLFSLFGFCCGSTSLMTSSPYVIKLGSFTSANNCALLGGFGGFRGFGVVCLSEIGFLCKKIALVSVNLKAQTAFRTLIDAATRRKVCILVM